MSKYLSYGGLQKVWAKIKSLFLPLSGGTMSNTNKVVNFNADLLDGYHIDSVTPKAIYNPGADGVLVRSSFNAASSRMCYIKIEGNCYGGGDRYPYFTILNFYDYTSSGGIIGTPRAVNLGSQNITEIKLFRYDGRVYIWFPRAGQYQTFYVTWQSQGMGGVNLVESMVTGAVPEDATNLVTVEPKNLMLEGEMEEIATTWINSNCT